MTTTTTLPADPGAVPERHGYPSSGRPFWLAVCRDRCGLILNSGHHFSSAEAAQTWCDEHNREHHAPADQHLVEIAERLFPGDGYEEDHERMFALLVDVAAAYVRLTSDDGRSLATAVEGALLGLGENLDIVFDLEPEVAQR